MATYTFSSSTGEIFTPVAGVPDTIDIPNVSDIHPTDSVVGTGSEAPNQDQLRLLQNSPGALSLDSAVYPNIFGVESFGLVGSHSAAFTFNLDYSWLSNNRDNTDYFTASFLNGTGGYTINITGTPVAGRFRVELGQGNDTLTGGTGDDWAVVSGTGSTLINLGAGLDNLIIAGLTSVSLSDTIEGGAGTDTLTFEAMVGTTAAINYTNVTGFEHLVFATQTGALDITLPQNVVSGPATMEIQGGTGSRAISFSTWSTSINVTTISATAPVSLSGGAADDTLRGGSAADSLSGGAGSDLLIPGSGTDTITTGAGADTITFSSESAANFDTITDLGTGDKIRIIGANFANGFSTATGNAGAGYTGKAWLSTDGLTLYGDVNNNGSSDFQITLSSPMVPANFTATGEVISWQAIPAVTLTVGTDSFTSFSPGPDIVNLGSVAHLTVVDTITAGVGDAPANADVLQLNTSGVTYTLQGANLPSITGLERIQTGLGGQYTVVVDADFLANNYDSTGRLTVAAAATTAFNQHFTLQGTPASGKFFSVVLPGITSSTNDTVIGSDGSDEVILNGLGTDSVNTGLGADTVFATLAQLSAADTLDGGSGTDTLVLTGGGTVNLGTFSKVTGFEVVRIADNGSSSAGLTLSNAFVTSAGGTVTLEMANISAVPVTFDASALTGSNRVIMTGASPVRVGITGGAGNDELYGRAQSGDSLNGGAGDDKLYPMLGGTGDFVTMGGGADTVFGTASDLDNLTISDFGSGDVIQITSHAFTGGVMAGTGSSTGMTAFSIRVDTAGNKLYLETTGDSTADATINLSSGGFSGSNFSVTSGTISYVAGPSLAFSATGGETVTGTVGNDTVTAATGTLSAGESIDGAGGSDTLHLTGGGGFNLNGVLGLGSIHRIITDNIATSVILPNTGTTRLVLGSGNDSITIGAGTSVNTIWGGAGSDEVTLGGGIMTTLVSNGGLDTGSMLISVSGNPNTTIFADGDTITGGSSANIVVVATTAVAPTVISLGGSSGSVTAFVHGTATTVVTGSNSDLLYGGPGSQRFDAGPGSDILIGEAGRDLLLGGAGNDMLVGGADGDILVAGSGQNTVWGDAGQDVFVLDTTGVDLITDFVSGVDRINVRAISGAIVDFASFEAEMTATSATNGWSYRLVSTPSIGFDVITATKLTAADFIFGQIGVGAAGAANETINGTSQDDLLLGLDGHDSLFGSAGADTLVAGMGADTLDGGADGDVFVFPAGTNAIIGAAPDVIVGLEASDTIRLGPSSLNLSLSASTTFTVGAVTAGPANGMADVLGLFSGTPGSTNSIVQTRSVTISGGALAGNVYLFINDGAVGGSAGPDMLIRLVGGSLPVASAFTVGEYL